MTVRPTRNTTHLPANQSCYQRDVLLALGDRLAPLLQAESVLQWELQAKGLRVRQAPGAFVYHLNNSRLGHTLLEYFFAAFVLEVDVDVGGFVPFLADEPFEQHVHAIGIDDRNP